MWAAGLNYANKAAGLYNDYNKLSGGQRDEFWNSSLPKFGSDKLSGAVDYATGVASNYLGGGLGQAVGGVLQSTVVPWIKEKASSAWGWLKNKFGLGSESNRAGPSQALDYRNMGGSGYPRETFYAVPQYAIQNGGSGDTMARRIR